MRNLLCKTSSCGEGFSIHPLSDLAPAEKGGSDWTATGPNPQFDLHVHDGFYPEGWVLFDTKLVRRSSDYSARLILDTGSGFCEETAVQIPVTLKGTVHELVFLPRGLKGIRWAPMMATGEIKQWAISFKKVGRLERTYRMMRRIVPMLWKHRREKLDSLNLNVRRMILDLEGAYRAAGKLRAYSPAPPYPEWIAAFDTLSTKDRFLIRRHIGRFKGSPRFIILVDARQGGVQLSDTLQSIASQLYRQFTVVLLGKEQDCRLWLQDTQAKLRLDKKIEVVDEGNAAAFLERLNLTLSTEDNRDYIALMRSGDRLSEHALYWMAASILSTPGAALLYSDHDGIDENGHRCRPEFKPDWSPELLRSTNYVGQLAVCRGKELASVGGAKPQDCFVDNHDLILRIADTLSVESIVHVQAVLCHRATDSYDVHGRSEHDAFGVAAVAAHLDRIGVDAAITVPLPGVYRIHYQLPPSPPMVSVMIPTRDKVELIERCVESLLQKTTYSCYEVVIIDNQSADPATISYLERISQHPFVRLLRYDQPFNYSAINNYAASHARGEILCLLNNDTEVISSDWMEEMVGHLIQDKVGAVGAKLYFADDRVQHAGDTVGVGGCANHLHAFIEKDDPGYCRRAILAQDLSAVTAACMMTRRDLYFKVGGLDETNLKVAFNDVDYCLRLREAGYHIRWTPYAELYHHESVSRGKDETPERVERAKREVAYMRSRWCHLMHHDPFYNLNLSYERPDFSLGNASTIRRPWLRR